MPASVSSLPVTAHRSGNSQDFQRECVAFFSEVVQVFGVPKSLGQIYGVLYASPEPLSFSDIVERLDISTGSVSQGLQLLRSLGAINVAKSRGQGGGSREQDKGAKGDGGNTFAKLNAAMPVPPASRVSTGDGDGARRVAYEPELGLRRLVSGILRERVMPLATAKVDRLTRLRELAEHTGADKELLLDRVKQLETWRRRLKTVLPVLTVMLGPKSKK